MALIHIFCSNLKAQIGQDKIPEVLEELSKIGAYLDSAHQNEIVILTAQFSALEKRKRQNAYDEKTLLQNANLIRINILSLIDELSKLEEQDLSEELNTHLQLYKSSSSSGYKNKEGDKKILPIRPSGNIPPANPGNPPVSQNQGPKWVSTKIAVLGAHAVGKTSLISQFVEQKFPEEYLTTIGLKVDKKVVELDNGTMDLVIWDIAGQDNFHNIPMYYLNDCKGFLIVSDLTRPSTFSKTAADIESMVQSLQQPACIIFLFNKMDLLSPEELQQADHFLKETCASKNYQYLLTSAKTRENVDEAFISIAHEILRKFG